MLLWLPATTAMHYLSGERALKYTKGFKPYVDTILQLTQKPSLMLKLETLRLEFDFFSRTGKISSHI